MSVAVVSTFILLLGDLREGEDCRVGPGVVLEHGPVPEDWRLWPEVRAASAGVVAVDGRLVVLPVPEDEVHAVPRLGGHQGTRQFCSAA